MQLGDSSYTTRVKGDFVLNFVAMATALVVVEFVWHHSIAYPRIPRTRGSTASGTTIFSIRAEL